MKKFLYLLLCLFMSVSMYGIGFHHTYHPVRIPHTVHRSSRPAPRPKAHPTPVKPGRANHPVHHVTREVYRPNAMGNMVLYFIIARNVNQHRYNGVDYVRCPVCHHTFIPKGAAMCTECKRKIVNKSKR